MRYWMHWSYLPCRMHPSHLDCTPTYLNCQAHSYEGVGRLPQMAEGWHFRIEHYIFIKIQAWHPRWITSLSCTSSCKQVSHMRCCAHHMWETCLQEDGSCEAEKNISAPRRIKSRMCVSKGQDRLAGLRMTAVHFSSAQQVNTQAIMKNYIQANPSSLFCHSVMFD